MTRSARKKKQMRIFKASIYLFALIGMYTVSVNVAETVKVTYQHGRSWVSSLEFKAPVIVKGE